MRGATHTDIRGAARVAAETDLDIYLAVPQLPEGITAGDFTNGGYEELERHAEKAGERRVKPRLAESAEELVRKVVALREGVGTDRGVCYPAIRVLGVGDFRVSGRQIEVIEYRYDIGVGTRREPTPAEMAEFEHAIAQDAAQVVVMSRWGGSGNVEGRASKRLLVLHEPRGNAWGRWDRNGNGGIYGRS